MLSLASLFVLLGILILFSLLANVSKTVNQKLEVQNGADAVASAATVELARGMNTITATNHLIGELFALTVLQHALGGDELEFSKDPPPTPDDIRTSLELSHDLAVQWSSLFNRPTRFAYNLVSQEPKVGAAIRDSRLRLKQVMTWAYIVHAAGGVLRRLGNSPLLAPLGNNVRTTGTTIMVNARVFEAKVAQEWLALDVLEGIARSLLPAKQAIRDILIPALHSANKNVFDRTPGKAEQLASDLGKINLVDGSLFPGVKRNALAQVGLQLPIREEPVDLKQIARSQMVRASTPWIQFWRQPLLRFGDRALLLARFRAHYQARTDEFTLTLADRIKKQQGVNLYILQDLDLDKIDKGQERWTQAVGSRDADRLFGTLGFALRKKPRVAAYGIFRQANPDGMAAYAQGMIYNANPQAKKPPQKGWQPQVGWDTLNWRGRVPDHGGPQPANPNPNQRPPRITEPRIRLNWQAKLVPATRLPDARPSVEGDLGLIIRRTPERFVPLSGVH
jgi:hypothetical protein